MYLGKSKLDICATSTVLGLDLDTHLFVEVGYLDQETAKGLSRTQQANLPAYLHTNPFKC